MIVSKKNWKNLWFIGFTRSQFSTFKMHHKYCELLKIQTFFNHYNLFVETIREKNVKVAKACIFFANNLQSL